MSGCFLLFTKLLVAFTARAFYLKGRMLDVVMFQLVAEFLFYLFHFLETYSLIYHQMDGQGVFRAAHRPYMEVVGVFYGRDFFYQFLDFIKVNALWHAV